MCMCMCVCVCICVKECVCICLCVYKVAIASYNRLMGAIGELGLPLQVKKPVCTIHQWGLVNIQLTRQTARWP